MQTYECPNCSGAVPFHASTIFTVCSFCQSMVLREGVDVTAIGKAASLPPDISPIQIGTTGKFGEGRFTVLGRIRLEWLEGAWTEWFVEFDDHSKGWLAEAQGFYMVSRERPAEEVKGLELQPGRSVTVAGVMLMVTDIKVATCAGVEGELPFAAPPGRRSVTVDLMGKHSAFGSIEESDGEKRWFLGRYCQFSELSFANLKAVPGWFGNAPLSHETGIGALNCPLCSAAVVLRTPGQTVSVTCPSCGCILDASNPKVEVVAKAVKELNITPAVPLGKRGTLFGVEWEAVGFMQRANGPYTWFEYLLFNPHHGYVWLVNADGHWNYVERLIETPSEGYHEATHDGRTYKLFLRGKAKVRYVLGEFYWRVKFNETAETADFIAPPYALSREEYPELKEVTWSRAQYVEPLIIEKAFRLMEPLREPTGVFMNQPNRFAMRNGNLGRNAAILLGLLLLIQGWSVMRSRNESVGQLGFTHVAGDTNSATQVIEFEVKGGAQALEVRTEAHVDNSWAEVAYELQNVQTLERRQFVESIEYYYGPDWSEGGRRKKTVVPGVAPGKYRLLIDTLADPQMPQVGIAIDVKRDVPVWRNFFVAFALLAAYPVYRMARSSSFEKQRWMESDFSDEYGFEEDDE